MLLQTCCQAMLRHSWRLRRSRASDSNPVLIANRAWLACMTSTVSKLMTHSPGAQVIQYKQLVGNERDASVQQDIDQAIDTLVQQLRLQVCTFHPFI